MTELETMNMLLRLIGSSPINDVGSDHPDAANARATLDRIRKRVQRKGWWCNIDYNIILTPDSTGAIRVGDTISALVAEDPSLILRGNILYNRSKQTAIFAEPVNVMRIIRLLEWDEMPGVMQEHCAYYSAAEFVRDEIEDDKKELSLMNSAAMSLIDMKSQELEEGQYNIFKKPRVARARAGIQPYSRGNKRFYGDPDV